MCYVGKIPFATFTERSFCDKFKFFGNAHNGFRVSTVSLMLTMTILEHNFIQFFEVIVVNRSAICIRQVIFVCTSLSSSMVECATMENVTVGLT